MARHGDARRGGHRWYGVVLGAEPPCVAESRRCYEMRCSQSPGENRSAGRGPPRCRNMGCHVRHLVCAVAVVALLRRTEGADLSCRALKYKCSNDSGCLDDGTEPPVCPSRRELTSTGTPRRDLGQVWRARCRIPIQGVSWLHTIRKSLAWVIGPGRSRGNAVTSGHVPASRMRGNQSTGYGVTVSSSKPSNGIG
jgi:hypothetical protein